MRKVRKKLGEGGITESKRGKYSKREWQSVVNVVTS